MNSACDAAKEMMGKILVTHQTGPEGKEVKRIYIEEATEIEIYYSSDADIAGFQFNMTGVEVLGASGGDADANGFSVSTSATTVLGFSFTGSVIPAGSGVHLH